MKQICFARRTKRHTYISVGNDIFRTTNHYQDLTFVNIKDLHLNGSQKAVIEHKDNWLVLGYHEDVYNAYLKYVTTHKAERAKRKLEMDEMRKKLAIKRKIEWEELLKLDIIPAYPPFGKRDVHQTPHVFRR